MKKEHGMRIRSLVLLPLLFTVAVVAGEHSPAEAIVPLSNGRPTTR